MMGKRERERERERESEPWKISQAEWTKLYRYSSGQD